jgi:hypothetical protein
MSMRIIKSGMKTVVLFAILAGVAACSGETQSPMEPTSTPVSAPAAPAAPATASVQIAINPSPVPFSGQPITDSAGCAGSKNTWFYQQNFKENGGVTVTFTSRIDKFDGRVVNNGAINLVLPALGATTLSSRWCSSQAVAHTAQSSFSGTDANGHTITVDGPVVALQSP